MDATGVSFAEQQMRMGKYYDQPPFPFALVEEVAEVDGGDVQAEFARVGESKPWMRSSNCFLVNTHSGSAASVSMIRRGPKVRLADG